MCVAREIPPKTITGMLEENAEQAGKEATVEETGGEEESGADAADRYQGRPPKSGRRSQFERIGLTFRIICPGEAWIGTDTRTTRTRGQWLSRASIRCA